jgi:fibronectin-binding autotransporter adhesin
MKRLMRKIGVIAATSAAVLIGGASRQSSAAVLYLDQNGANPGLWDGTTKFIGTDITNLTTWTSTVAGTATPTTFNAGTAGNNLIFGAVDSDFNGVTINVTNNLGASIGQNPALLSIVSTNVVVNFLATSANERFNATTTIAVTNGSTLNIAGNPANNWNWNGKLYTFVGNGTVNVSNALGNNDSTSAGGGITMNMAGGKLQLFQTGIGTFGNGATGSGTGFTLTNGTLNFVSPQSFNNVFGAFAAIQTVKFNGGAFDNLSGAPATLNVNQGSYSFGGDFAYVGSSQSLNLGNANVTLAVTPQITVSANTLTVGGVIADNGLGLGITKAGNGTLILNGANTYSGPTTVNAGTLMVSTASTGAGPYTSGDGGTLGVKVASTGQALNMSSLTLGATTGGALQFDLGALGNPTSAATAPIHVTGALTVNGANSISLTSVSAITNFPVVIPLISYGSASGNLAGFTTGTFPASTPAFSGYISNDASGQVIDLVLTSGQVTLPPGNPKPLTWVGSPSGNWDTTTFNWLTSGVLTNYANVTLAGSGDPVTFDDSLTGTTNVNLTTALAPTTLTLNNNSSNYVFRGTGRITGATALTLNGTQSLTLDNSGNNDFNGGITINSGLLQIGNGDTNGNPGTGAITDNGALVFNRTDSTLGASTPLGVLSGSGVITNNGSGTLAISGVQPFAGTITVNAGTITVTGPNSNPSALSACTGLFINGGIVQVLGDNVLGNAAPGVPITVNAGGALTGNGTSGHLRGLLTLNGGTLRMDGNQNNTANGTWDLNNNVTVPGGPTTSTISALNVVPENGGGTVFNVTNGTTASGIDLLVSGSLINGTGQHDTGIIKNGPGVMALDNNNTYILGTTINGPGTLQVGLPADAAALSTPLGIGGVVTINTGGVLNFNSGKGVIVSNAIADDATGTVLISRGSNILAGVNSYTGATVVNSGATLALNNAGSINNSTVISVSNATFDASAGAPISSSGSLVMTNSTFNLGTNQVSTITALSISNSTIAFSLTPGAVNVNAGTLTTGGSTNVINITAVLGFPVYPTNLTLIKYGSFGGVDGGNHLTTLGLSLPAAGSPVAYLTNNVANGSIDLVLQSTTLVPIFPITWNGQAGGVNNGSWDSLTTSNWLLTVDGVTPYSYQDLSAVTFDDSAHGTTSVTVTTAVKPASLSVSNTVKNYTFSGAGSIGGPVTLVKTNAGSAIFMETGGDNFTGGVSMGGGTLVLSNANAAISGGLTVNNGTLVLQHSGTIAGGLTVNSGSVLLDQAGTVSGGTLINVGRVQVGNNDALGSLPSGGLTNNDTLIFNRSDSALTIGMVIAGTGAVTNNGTGTVTLSTTETMTGPVVANAGTLVLNAGNNTSPNGISRAASLTINNGATVAVLSDNSLAGHGAAAGTLPIFINAGGTLTGAASLANGTSTHIPGLLTLDGGTLANSGTSLQLANGSWDLDDGVATVGGPVTSTISAFDVVPSQSGGTHFTVLAPIGAAPASGIDLNVTGSLINGTGTHDSGIILDGTGTVAFSGTNTYIQGTTLDSGVLIANAPENPPVSGPLGITGLITFNGGTLRYSATNNFDYSGRFAGGGSYNIDTAGRNVTYATALTSGSLTKIGNGTLTLGGANSYNGDTIVGRGTLTTTTASVGGGNYTVTNGSTLDVQVAAAGAQLTMNTLTLGGGASDTSTLQVDTLATGNPTVAPVNVAGIATAGTVKIALSGTALTANTFPLLSYGGSSPSTALQFIPPTGFTGSLSDNHAGLISVTLVAAAAPTTNANITRVSLSGTNLLVHGTNNNVPNTSFRYVVLTSTNLALPLGSWTPVLTNSFKNDGTFDYTNPVVPATPQQFIDVQTIQ